MLDKNNHHGGKPSLRLKRLFGSQRSKNVEGLAISPPLLQHAGSSIVDSLVSPTTLRDPYLNSVPPRVSSMPKHYQQQQQQQQPSSQQPLARRARAATVSVPNVPKKSGARPSRLPRPIKVDAAPPPPKKEKRLPPVPSSPLPSSRRHSFASNLRAKAQSNLSTTSVRTASTSLEEKKRHRQSRAAIAVASLPSPLSPPTPQRSKSTPLRIKTYNVYDQERLRKQRELEELISGGRRGSTVKLTLTPRKLN